MPIKNQSLEATLEQFVAGKENTQQPKEIKAEVMPGVENLTFHDENENSHQIKQTPVEQAPQKKKNVMAELEQAQVEKIQEIKEYQKANSLGFVQVPVADLPTKGLFYPEGTKVYIRAASGGEIRHWSMTNEEELTEIDDALNYMLERCMNMSFPDKAASWKDLKDIDRLYIILAIRDFTFTKGNNELKIKIDETHEEVVTKDSIDFVNFPEKLMSHYDEQIRCFVFKIPESGKHLNIYMPSVGVSSWLKNYVQKKARKQEGFDKDFITIAPMLIKDYRNLNDKTYEEFIAQCYDFGVYEYSLLAKIKEIFNDSLDPKFRYKDEDGADKTSPLNFLGGIKGFFLLDVDHLI